ncbi:MAG TPA: MFS transporter [Candidatus Binataceae bacterium]|nr:MFS transporter [Candidatus Binataceae bacterium]
MLERSSPSSRESLESTQGSTEIFETLIPARLDRLPWNRFHWLLVVGLGITWVLDGLEVTLMGAISAVLQRPDVLHFTAAQIGSISSAYLAGAVLGSLVFGHLTDRFGRRTFFFISLATYLIGVGLTALSWNLVSFAAFRFLTGAGIGGEYSAVNSAIDELIPARLRGRIDLMINGSFWLGALAGAASTGLILNTRIFAVDVGWRLGFGIGAVIGLAILYLRRFIPESPRWLMTHGRREEAEELVRDFEAELGHIDGTRLPDLEGVKPLRIRVRHHFGLDAILGPLLREYRERAVLSLSLMTAQAFLYNAIFFTYALVLARYYGVPASVTGLYLMPFALSNFVGPMVLGHFFDTIGRRPMIAGTFTMAALTLIVTGYLFERGALTATSQTVLWSVMFFFASSAASSAYLTVSEIFPLEIRALAIAIFFSIGTAVGGVVAPWLFGVLIDTGSRGALYCGYLIAAGLMLAAAVVELRFGVAAEQVSLEDIAKPLSSVA